MSCAFDMVGQSSSPHSLTLALLLPSLSHESHLFQHGCAPDSLTETTWDASSGRSSRVRNSKASLRVHVPDPVAANLKSRYRRGIAALLVNQHVCVKAWCSFLERKSRMETSRSGGKSRRRAMETWNSDVVSATANKVCDGHLRVVLAKAAKDLIQRGQVPNHKT